MEVSRRAQKVMDEFRRFISNLEVNNYQVIFFKGYGDLSPLYISENIFENNNRIDGLTPSLILRSYALMNFCSRNEIEQIMNIANAKNYWIAIPQMDDLTPIYPSNTIFFLRKRVL